MSFNRQKIEARLEEIRFRDAISSDTMKEMLKPFFEDPELEGFKDYFASEGYNSTEDLYAPTEYELELGRESEDAWTGFAESLFASLELFCSRNEEGFYKSLERLAGALDSLWMSFHRAGEIQDIIPDIFRECDQEYFSANEEKMIIALYNSMKYDAAKASLLNRHLNPDDKSETIEPPDAGSLIRKFIQDYKEGGNTNSRQF